MLEIKGKAVELLEVMLEETSPESAAIKKSLQGSVNVHSLVESMMYFRMMATEPSVKKKEKDDDAERGKFQCYHVLIGLADSDGKIENIPVGTILYTHTHTHKLAHTCTHTHTHTRAHTHTHTHTQICYRAVNSTYSISLTSEEFCDKLDADGKEWRKQSCSVEIRFKYENEKHLLTKVHFFRDKDVSINTLVLVHIIASFFLCNCVCRIISERKLLKRLNGTLIVNQWKTSNDLSSICLSR